MAGFNKNNPAAAAAAAKASSIGGVELTPPGINATQQAYGSIKYFNPLNATDATNTLGGTAMGNGLGSFPANATTMQGFQQSYANLIIYAESFLPAIGETGNYGYRQVFDKAVIPLHSGTMTKQFTRITGMDTNPLNAALGGLATSYNPTMNEVTIKATAKLATTNAWGRYFKMNSFAQNINAIDWKMEYVKAFAMNASDTLNNLAGMRLWEGANKMYVQSIADFDPTNPNAPRLTLGADASTVAAPLSLDALLEAKYLMQNNEEVFTNIKPATGETEDLKRKRPIPGFRGSSYLVLLGSNGYNQVMRDDKFRESFVVNGGVSAQGILDESVGKSNPIFGLRFEVINTPLTITKASTPALNPDGTGDLEVAYVVGGGVSPVGIELSLEGYTKMIDVPYNDSRKVDPFELLSITGWMAIVDFTVLQNEGLYAIPYTPSITNVSTGASNIKDPLVNSWNK